MSFRVTEGPGLGFGAPRDRGGVSPDVPLSLNQVPCPIVRLFGALAFTAHLSLPKGF